MNDINITHKIGKRIRELRLSKGITQEELAYDSCLDRTYISSVENGKRNISIINIEKICLVLDVSLCDFFNSVEFKI